jgi:transposase-like protein
MQHTGEVDMSEETSKIHGFTIGQALDVFSKIACDETGAAAWVLDQLHPDGLGCCPGCYDQNLTARQLKTFREGGRVKCPACNKFYTNRTNTILHSTHLTFNQVYFIAALLAFADRTGADRMAARREIARIIGIHPDSIKSWEKIFSALESPLV